MFYNEEGANFKRFLRCRKALDDIVPTRIILLGANTLSVMEYCTLNRALEIGQGAGSGI